MNAPSSPWKWWQDALRDPSKIGSDSLPVHEDTPQMGYYRMRQGKGGEFAPVAIVVLDGALTAVVGPWSKQDRRTPGDVWTYCCRSPIHQKRHEAIPASGLNWTDVAVDGKPWPDSIKSLIASVPDPEPGAEPEAGIGHNSGAEPVSERDKLRAEMDELAGKAKAFRDKKGKVSLETWTKTDADVLSNATTKIAGLKTAADNARKAEKKPYLDKQREIDASWNEIIEAADAAVKDIKATIGEYLRLAEAEKAAAARKEAERLAAEREAERAKLPATMQDLVPEAAPAPVETPKARVGTGGRTISLVDKHVATITDPVAFATHLLPKDRPSGQLMEVLQAIADRMAPGQSAGHYTMPGVTVSIQRVPR